MFWDLCLSFLFNLKTYWKINSERLRSEINAQESGATGDAIFAKLAA
jgi:hypothetical protein